MPKVPVRVRIGESTLYIGSGMMGEFPVTIRTAIVSPTARPMPRMSAAVMPERAEGTTTCEMVCHRVVPRAREPSRYSFGTAEMASSETLMIVGRAMMPKRTEPASQVSPVGTEKLTLITSVRTIRPKNPYTTDGMPARSSIAGLNTAFTRGDASSAMTIAHAMPRGAAMTIAPMVTRRVPTHSGRVPYVGIAPVGFQVAPKRNSHGVAVAKMGRPSFTRNAKMKNTVSTPKAAVANQTDRMIRSFRYALRPAESSADTAGVPVVCCFCSIMIQKGRDWIGWIRQSGQILLQPRVTDRQGS